MLTNPAIKPGYADDGAAVAGDITASGVSWAAVFAGGVTAAAVSIILLLFGTGLGLSSISPWPGAGVSVTTFTVLAAIWLIIVQWVSAGLGGYMAGRLRTKWTSVHTDEVFFRDTAHGFLAWALGTLIVAVVLASATTSALSGATKAVSGIADSATANSYYVGQLFRQNANPAGSSVLGGASNGTAAPVTGQSDQEVRAEATTILAQSIANAGSVSAADNAYLTQLVSEQTGLAPADAQERVNDVLNEEQEAQVKAKQVADAARKTAADTAIYTFISLLLGAFIASVAGAIGGRLRDTY